MNLEFKNIKETDLENIAQEVSKMIEDFFQSHDRSCVIFLNGDLGAGKTTFTKTLGRILNIDETIISPTFILRKDYNQGKLIHIDGYRFESGEEARSLALERELDTKGKIILIEWPDKFVNEINLNPDISIDFTHVNEFSRNISIKIH